VVLDRKWSMKNPGRALGALLVWQLALALTVTGTAQPPALRLAVPRDAIPAILDAFTSHSIVALGELHGHRERRDFLHALVADPRFASVVNDVVIEQGNSAEQAVLDRFVAGEDIPLESLRRVWGGTALLQSGRGDLPELFQIVRRVNVAVPKPRQLRILLGEAPIDRDHLPEAELAQPRGKPASDRDRFVARLLEREVVKKHRRALVTFGSGHLVRRSSSHSLVTLLESKGVSVFNIWTNVCSLSAMQSDVESWPVPSLVHVAHTQLGANEFFSFYPPTIFRIPEAWRTPLQDQFDALLYLGAETTFEFSRR
jgi:hypothetical protein